MLPRPDASETVVARGLVEAVRRDGRAGRRTVLATVTLTAVAVLVLPAASRATAVRLWAPLAAAVVSQLTE